MRSIPGRLIGRAVLGAGLVLTCVLALATSASAAGYPRRIAIAPFTVLTKEDIGATVSVLPRLLSSRLMALAGADVLIIPPGKPPEEAAKEAKYPLLLQGTVSKLGKGYSVDTTVTDLTSGGPAGAFFAAAATEDEIIQQLGVLSGEIAEKLFGVQGAIRATAPAAPVQSPATTTVPPPAQGASQAISAVSAVAIAGSGAQPAVQPATAPELRTLADGWVPSSLKKVGQSDKIADEIYGVTAGDVDAEGNGEVVTWGRNVIYVYKVKGNEVVPYTRVTRGVEHHFLNVEAADINGDGKADLLVTDLQGERMVSFVLVRKGDGFVEVPGTFPYHLAVLRDATGKTVVAGQRGGISDAFQGKIHAMKWDGNKLSPGEALPIDTAILPVSGGGVYGLSQGQFGTNGKWLYVDVEEKLRVLDGTGKSVYKSKEKFGSPADGFEYGEMIRLEGRYPVLSLRRAPRVIAGSKSGPLVAVIEVRKGPFQHVIGTFESSRAVILQWEGGGFAERAASPKGDSLYSGVEVLPPGRLNERGKLVASVIEQQGTAFKDKVSRLVLLQAE